MNWFLFAQADTGVTQVGLQVAAGVVSLGFAVWYAYHTTTKTIPEMIARHAETVSTLVKEFRDESREQRAEYRERVEHSMNLANTGHEALNNVRHSVNELRQAVLAGKNQ